ncbi:hypothetical protein B7494_g3215 [Chlorociboria aeruginascens]|nr:hypothetical protein B7494_g3215 [Chlorociboria aeruginascens]
MEVARKGLRVRRGDMVDYIEWMFHKNGLRTVHIVRGKHLVDEIKDPRVRRDCAPYWALEKIVDIESRNGNGHSSSADGFSDISEGPSEPGSPTRPGDGHISPLKEEAPISEYEQKKATFITRSIWTFVMIGAFFGAMFMGHIYIIAIVTAVQIVSFKEVIAIANVPSRARRLRFTKALNWYWLATTMYFLYGESVIYYFKHIVLVDKVLLPFATHHRFISFMLYVIGFVFFVASLQAGHYRFQFTQFAWTHMALYLIVVQAHFIMNNVFEGMIWFFLPVSLVICNDIFAYICGITFGRTQLIKLSPKKTVEGFVGAWVLTVIFGIGMTNVLMRYKYFVCPVNDLGANIWTGLECTPNPVFIPHVYHLPIWFPVIKSFSMAPMQVHILVFATFASLIAPFGGFFASGLKRTFKIKDFGDSIPGHGGITDRMDCQFIMGFFAYMYYHSFIAVYKVSLGGVIETAIIGLTPEEQMELVKRISKHLHNQGVISEGFTTLLQFQSLIATAQSETEMHTFMLLLALLPIISSSPSTHPPIHYPLTRRSGSFPSPSAANLTYLLATLEATLSRYNNTHRTFQNNKLVRKPNRNYGTQGSSVLLGEVGREGNWFANLKIGEPAQQVDMDIDMLTKDWFLFSTSSRKGSWFWEFKSSSYRDSERPLEFPTCREPTDNVLLPTVQRSVSISFAHCRPSKQWVRSLLPSGAYLGLAPSASLSQTKTISLLEQLIEKDIIDTPIWSVMLLNGRDGLFSIGGTSSAAVKRVEREIADGLNRLAIPDNGNRDESSDWGRKFDDQEAIHADIWKWSKVQGADGWWQILMRGVWVNGDHILMNQPATLDINTPFIIAPPLAARSFYASISGSRQLLPPYDQFHAYPCFSPPQIHMEFSAFKAHVLKGKNDKGTFSPGGRFSLGRMAMGSGYCIGIVVESRMGVANSKGPNDIDQNGMADLWIIGEPFFRDVQVAFNWKEKQVGMQQL